MPKGPPRMSTGGKARRDLVCPSVAAAPPPAPPPYAAPAVPEQHVIPRHDNTTPVSHLLLTTWTFSPFSTPEEHEDLRRDFAAFMSMCSHSFAQNEPAITVRWKSSDGGRTFTTFSPLSEEYVRMLTDKRLLDFSYQPTAKAATSLEYLVAKNLSFTFSLTRGRTEMNNGVQMLQIE